MVLSDSEGRYVLGGVIKSCKADWADAQGCSYTRHVHSIFGFVSLIQHHQMAVLKPFRLISTITISQDIGMSGF
jgi:hypothetical protein